GGYARCAVGDATSLGDRPTCGAADHGSVVGALAGDGDDLLGTVDRDGGNLTSQRLPDIKRLHGGIGVVQRVGPDAGRCHRVAAIAAVAPQYHRHTVWLPGVVGIVNVGGIEVSDRDGYARRAVGHPTGLGHRPAGDAADHCVVVPAVDGDGD